MNCSFCGQPKATRQIGVRGDQYERWFHEDCFLKMPPKNVFPSAFQRTTSQENFDNMIKPYVKNGKFKLN